MDNHTKGPWHVGGKEKCTIYDKFGQRIGNTFEGVMATHRSDSECQANAAVMAAAPDMRDAIQQFIATQLTVGQRYTNEGQALLDALAKADGIVG